MCRWQRVAPSGVSHQRTISDRVFGALAVSPVVPWRRVRTRCPSAASLRARGVVQRVVAERRSRRTVRQPSQAGHRDGEPAARRSRRRCPATDPCAPLSPCATACRPLRLAPLTLVDAGDSYPLARRVRRPCRQPSAANCRRSLPRPRRRASLEPAAVPSSCGRFVCLPSAGSCAPDQRFESRRPDLPRRCPARARPAAAAGCRPCSGRACGRVALPSTGVATMVRPPGVEQVALAAFGVA